MTLAITYGQQLVLGYQFLWFIPILIQLYLLYPLLKNTYNYSSTQKSLIYILSFFLVVQVGYVALRTAFPSQSVDLYLGVLFLSYVFYFVFGFFIAQHYEVMKQRLAKISLKIISLVVLASTLCYAFIFYHAVLVSPALHDYVWLEVVTAPFYCLLLIIFYLKISTFLGEPHGRFLQYLEKIGEDSFGIYLVHWFFVGTYATLLLLLGLNPHNLILYPILFFLTLISSYLVVEAIYRLPFSNIIIGSRRKKATS